MLLVHLGIQWNLLGVLRKGCWMALGRRSLASHHSLPGINGMYSATWDDCDGWTCHWRKLNQSWNHTKNPSKLSSDFGALQTPNHCQKSKISQQNHPPKLHQFRPQHPTDDSTGPRCWFPMAKDPWWFSSLTIVVGLEPFYKKTVEKCHAVSVSPICRGFFLPKLWSNTPNIHENPPTENESHANKRMWTTTQVYIVWYLVA